jgi:DNA polymerase III epsilon subunit-like protein
MKMKTKTKADAREMARGWLQSGAVFLDTETTGLGEKDEVCEIAVMDVSGGALVDTLVRPRVPIGTKARDIHGITDGMVMDAPGIVDVLPELRRVTHGRPVVIYNAEFDTRILIQSLIGADNHVDSTADDVNIGAARCAMLLYAQFAGVWDDSRGSWKWHKLSDACAQMGIKRDARWHRARADVEMCRRLVWAIANS